MKKSIITLVFVMIATFVSAQRVTDKIDRGLVAVPASTGNGNFVSWHVFGEEYYDVTYNLYCNGSPIATNLKLSSYTHAAGTASSKYQVAAVVRGVEQAKSKEVTRWEGGMLTIPVQKITGRDGTDVTANYTLNDISIGDLDGDGIVEFIVKRPCSVAADVSQKNCFHVLDCYDHKGNRLWWIDLGPNMLAGADEQWDCVCYDWDQDGKAEVLLRIQDNAYIHYSDGTTQLIGSANVDTRWNGIEFTSSGNEYLLYLEGATGKPYAIGDNGALWMTYPLTRGQDSDWGEGIVGHRSTKHYFGAPFLDGRKASIFLGRGAYTKHKFTALDVDPATHKLTQLWYWENNVGWDSPWYGNGYHNFAIGDVDWDGRDEIIFGSMVIDDNGKGLSTTGLGHGDAQHCSDFDPYRKYEEQFACNEDEPAMNYRNAATSEIYYRYKASGDDGRALMANFTNAYPGSVGRSVSTGWVSSVADKEISDLGGDAFINWGDLNQRIYWDGDLLDEYFDSPGTEGYGAIYKPAGGGRWNFPDSKCNNWTKNNPGGIADIFGDWREELIMRKSDNTAILVYTTPIPTTYRIPTLWHDHQYRNAMVWQSMGYNQPPHKSYFLGEMEGITQAPPPLTMTGRTEVANGGTITTTDEHLLVCDMGNTNISIADGASPYMVTFNVPSHVQGNAESNTSAKPAPTFEYSTCTVTGGALTGDTRVVKQGDGILTWPKVAMSYTGETNIWAGTLNFDGTLRKSPLWLNRFAELNSNGGQFYSIKADYGAIIRPGGENARGSITVDSTLTLGFGSRVVLDLYSDGLQSDKLNAKTLRIEKKSGTAWQNFGPKNLQPIFEIVEHFEQGATSLATGDYIIGKVDSLNGSLANIKVEGVTEHKVGLSIDANHNLILTLGSVRGPSEIVWNAVASSKWDFANSTNFYLASDENKNADFFVTGDIVNFTDEASRKTVTISEALSPDTVKVNSSKAYTFSGTGSIASGALVKEGEGSLTINNENSYTGGNYLKGGTVIVSALSNENKATGNLGGVTGTSNRFTMENGATLQTSSTVTNGSPIRFIGDEGGVINNSGDFNQNKSFYGTTLTKKGSGWLKAYANGSNLSKLIIQQGVYQNNNGVPAKAVEIQGGTLNDGCTGALSTPIDVPAGKSGTFTLGAAYYQAYNNKITGSGTLTIVPTNTVSRVRITGDWSKFEGTIKHTTSNIWLPLDNSSGIPNGTLDIANGCTVANTAGKTFSIGKLTGSGNLSHSGCDFKSQASITNTQTTWQAGNSLEDGDFTYSGIILDNGSNKSLFNKIGTCKMTVAGAWTNSGAIQVKAGELTLKQGALLGTGALTVAAGATLSGVTKSGTPLTNSSVTVNGTLQVGSSSTAVTGTMDFGGKNVTFGSSSTIKVGLRRCATTSPQNSYITNVGTLKFNDGATISVVLGTTYTTTIDEAVPDSFYVWFNCANATVGNVQFDLPELPVYNYWDTSKISEGKLLVRCDKAKYDIYVTDIRNIDDDETVSVEVVSARGAVVDNFTSSMSDVQATFGKATLPKGIYLLRVKSETGKKGTMKLMK